MPLNIGLPVTREAWQTNLGGLATDMHNRMNDAHAAALQIAQAGNNTANFTDAPPAGLGYTADEEYAQRVAVEKLGLLYDWYIANVESFTRPLRGVIGA